MNSLELCVPELSDEAEFVAMHGEFLAFGGRIYPGVIKRFKGNFVEYIKELEDICSGRREGYVPGRAMFMKDENGRIYGMVSLRFGLNDDLLRRGGHIGYGIRPSERGKGYGTLQLKLALEEMRKTGIYRVLITCDKDNPTSAKVIQNCGGALENEVEEDGGNIIQRYWIGLPEIVRVTSAADLPECLSVIRASCATVAEQFCLTESNNPTHGAFMKAGKLREQYDNGNLMFACRLAGRIVGFCELEAAKDGGFYLEKLTVLPEFRHNGYGRMLIEHCKSVAKEKAASSEPPERAKISIGIIEENTVLKDWYAKNGFVRTGTKKFAHLPFTVGFMEWEED